MAIPRERFDKLDAWLGALAEAVPSPEQMEARRLGAALRLVIDRMVTSDAPAAELAAAADQVEALAERLSSFDHGGLFRGLSEDGQRSGLGHPTVLFDWAPLLGRSNPVAPPLEMSVVDGQLVGRARFGNAYEGPPGCVHGGFIAACFDDVLGLVQAALEEVAMTGTLSVRYVAPTRLHTEVRFVGKLVGRAGRKITTKGELWVGEGPAAILTAEADGVFITVDGEQFRRMWGAAGRPPIT
jgi:acyl-coenzyme A thioesterase PaaI-like protein